MLTNDDRVLSFENGTRPLLSVRMCILIYVGVQTTSKTCWMTWMNRVK